MSGLGIGEQLVQARAERGLTLEDAERDTRISQRYLAALEAEQFDVIPAPVYARGFLRSYSQYLGLEPASLLARFPREDSAGDLPASRSPNAEDPSAQGPSARGPSTLFRSRVPEEPMIGVDIGVAIPARGFGGGPFPFARVGVIAAVAVGVTALVIMLALVIVNLAGSDGGGAVAGQAQTFTPTPQTVAETPTTSGLDVQRGVVPDVVGQTEEIARLAVEEAGFVVTVVTDRSEQYPRGTVSDQSPTAGVEQEPGRGVTIAVSEGP